MPTLTLAGGGNQRGSPGTVLPTPITVLVNSFGTYNAPLTFAVASGAAQVASGSGNGYTPSATVDVRSVSPFPDAHGRMTYVAQAYVYLPDTGNNRSTITITARSGSRTTTVSTVAIASDPAVQPPSAFSAAATSAITAALSWTPSDPSLATNVEASDDGGVTWRGIGSFSPGAASGTIHGLTPDRKIRLRLYTASGTSTGTAASGSGESNAPASVPGAGGGDGSNPTDGQDVEPLSAPVVEGESAYLWAADWSYGGYQSSAASPTRYLNQKSVFTYPATHYEPTSTQTILTSVDIKTGEENCTGGPDYRYFSGEHNTGGWKISGDTSMKRTLNHDYSPVGVQDVSQEATLSTLYPIEQFKMNAEGWVPGFKGSRRDGMDRAFLYYEEPFPYGLSLDGGYPEILSYTHTYQIDKLQYQFRCNADPDGKVVYDIVFTPEDGSGPVHEFHVLPTHGKTEVPDEPLTLDPLQLHHKQNGTYQVVPVALQPDDWTEVDDPDQQPRARVAGAPEEVAPDDPGQTGVKGSLVPSSQGATGARHFVSPRKAVDFVWLRGQMPSPGRFEDLFEWVPGQTAEGVAYKIDPARPNKIGVPRDHAGKFPVRYRVKSSGAVSDDTEWHISLRLQRANGKWIDDGTTQGPGAP